MTDDIQNQETTSFQIIYDAFLNLVTDDMYLEWGEEETYSDIKNIFMAALSKFEFPRFRLYDFNEEGDEDYFNFELTREEINIFAHLMVSEWMTRQLASIDVVRQAYSSRDFEFTSQANHLDKLIKLKNNFSLEATRLQRLYTRRVLNSEGFYEPNYKGFGGKGNAN